MFPKPIAQARPLVRTAYKLFLPIALFLWLLPLIGIAVTSIRPSSDLAAGNYFGMPSGFAGVENYTAVFKNSNIGRYILNSFKVTIATVIGAVGLSCLTGYALAIYKFRGNLVVFFIFIAGNFVPFQILAIPVRNLTLNMGLYNTMTGLVMFHIAFQTGFCTWRAARYFCPATGWCSISPGPRSRTISSIASMKFCATMDALERLDIQRGARMFFPPVILGSHISASPRANWARTWPLAFPPLPAICSTARATDSSTALDPLMLGVCYYPEQWPQSWWADDARRMRNMGISFVRIGEFAWSRYEPVRGRFDWSPALQNCRQRSRQRPPSSMTMKPRGSPAFSPKAPASDSTNSLSAATRRCAGWGSTLISCPPAHLSRATNWCLCRLFPTSRIRRRRPSGRQAGCAPARPIGVENEPNR